METQIYSFFTPRGLDSTTVTLKDDWRWGTEKEGVVGVMDGCEQIRVEL